MAMTIESVRDRLASWYGGSEACLDAKACAELGDMIAALDAHLTQPAQAVDVGAIREVIAECQRVPLGGVQAGALEAFIVQLAPKLTRALSAEKAGWRDGWREFIEGCANSAGGRVDGTHLSERAKCLLAGSNGEAWTLDSDGHKTYWPSAEIAERERTNLAVLGHPATVIPPSFYGWRAAFHAQRAAAMRAHTICYETMQAHPEVAELGDDGRLHDAIHDILRIDGPASPTPDKEG
jgi:hypothetical protein